MADPYETLGVERDATAQEIRKAYVRRARALHPDRWVERTDAERKQAERAMQDVNQAWDILGDADRRARHDRERTARSTSGPQGAYRNPAARPSAPPPRPTPPRQSVTGVPPRPVGARGFSTKGIVLVALAPILALGLLGVALSAVLAVTGDAEPDEAPSTSIESLACVSIAANDEAIPVSCEGPNDGYVVAEVTPDYACGQGRRHALPGGQTVLCLLDVAPSGAVAGP